VDDELELRGEHSGVFSQLLIDMRASNEHYYNLKRLHWVFAISSLALLAVTIWMLAADHRRAWKQYQRTFRDRVEPWMTEARIGREQDRQFLVREQQLSNALAATRGAAPQKGLIERFCVEVEKEAGWRDTAAADSDRLRKAYDALVARPGVAARQALLSHMQSLRANAALRMEEAKRRLQFRRAEFDEARTYYEAGVGEGLRQERLDRLQQKVDDARADVDRLGVESENAAEHLRSLDRIVLEITAAEDAAREALNDHRAVLAQLQRTLDQQRPAAAKRVLRYPVVDALGRPLAIDQIWLPELTIDYNFRQVARFDRCVTCHQGIGETQPGSPSRPAFRLEETFAVELTTPDRAPVVEVNEAGEETPPSLESVYGLLLAEKGMLDERAATVRRVLPKTPAAEAKLSLGDVIVKIDDKTPVDPPAARRLLLEEVEWGQPLKLQIRRGLPQPYCSHPRPDLFVGSLSPHPMAEFGCTICHDGQGSATGFSWASHTPNDPDQGSRWRQQDGWFRNPHWDYPMLPARFAQSRCLKCHHDVTDLEPSRRFPEPPAAKLLAGYHLVRQNGCFGCHEINGFDESGRSIGPDMRLETTAASAARQQIPGTMRKVGPSLRDVGEKVEAAFLADWIADPKRFLPSARMPRFYGIHEHLDDSGRNDARRFEAVEIRAAVEYLLAVSRPVQPPAAPQAVTEPPSVERGKRLFQIHGCLACHKHGDFPEGQATQGPDLTGMGAKFTTEAGRQWLLSWIRDPLRHSPRTLMPNALLEPISLTVEGEDAEPAGGESKTARATDPAADIAAYLLAAAPWRPKPLPPAAKADLDELAVLHLSKIFPSKRARRYVEEGIPQSMADRVQGDAVELLGPMTPEKKLRYVGRRVMRTRGCSACHDVPGLEDAPAIGPALSDWGRKQESLLAFGQVHRFVEESTGDEGADADPGRAFFIDALLAHRREGFIWQKLRAPRSFDYETTQNKPYDERLTMPRFEFAAAEREAIITFVLGLVGEPPVEKYVYSPDVRQRAIVEGRKVLDRYACSRCHTIEMERWSFEFDPDEFMGPPPVEDYDFLAPQFSPRQIEASLATDNRGLGHGEVVGMPRVDADGQLLIADDDEDDDGNAAFLYGFTLWEPAVINGEACTVGGADVLLWGPEMTAGGLPAASQETGQFNLTYFGSRITGISPAFGGEFARLLYPMALAEARAAGSAATGPEAWGWVPPPLNREGAMVRPAWLHDYLLNPTAIRPAAILRMPRYNMSPAEAGKLVDYFAAVADVDFPYALGPGDRSNLLVETGSGTRERLDEAMKMVVDTTTYCAKCHLIGDFSPGGEIRTTLAPNLENVAARIRPAYLRRRLANPKSVLPYTGMPVNFPPTGDSIDPERFPGDSRKQLDAMTDLLLNYDWYAKRQISIRERIGRGAKEEPAQPAASAAELE